MLRSMTGYGRGEATIGGRRIVFEIKSVNHKFFEFNSRITRGYLFLEDKLKAYVQGKISRGKVDVFLQIETLEETDVQVLVNHSLASAYVKALEELQQRYQLPDGPSLALLSKYSDIFSVHKAPEDEDAVWEAVRQVADMAIAALEGEKLGQGETTDFLAVSFSSTDYIGHRYGTRAPQTEEAYRQLDQDLARLLSSLDSAVGKGNYLLFLSADHAAAHNAALMQEHGVPAGEWDEPSALNDMNEYLKKLYNTQVPLVKDLIEYRVYLDHEAIKAAGKDVGDVEEALCAHISGDDRVAYAVPFAKAQTLAIPQAIRERITNGYNPKRSGDIQIILQPGYYGFDSGSFHEGTSHGVWCSYDTHIPLLFYGWNIPNGRTAKETHVTDIAATICSLLNIQSPNGCIGEPIELK